MKPYIYNTKVNRMVRILISIIAYSVEIRKGQVPMSASIDWGLYPTDTPQQRISSLPSRLAAARTLPFRS